MAVNYVVVERGNPGNPAAPKKWYAQSKSTGRLTLKKLSKEIAKSNATVGAADVLTVLKNLTKVLSRHLEAGKIVRLGDFGTFQITVSSEGAETGDKFSSSFIRSSKVTFRSGSGLREMLNSLKYAKEQK